MAPHSSTLAWKIPWTEAYQSPQSMEFSRQEYRTGLLFPSPGDLPDPGIEPRSPALQEDSLPAEPQGKWGLNRWALWESANTLGIITILGQKLSYFSPWGI